VLAQYEPAVHEEHTVEPVDTWNVPARQFEQLEVEDAAAKVPARHLEQTVDEKEEYDPAAHTPVTADNPVEAQYEPAVQEEHAEEPVEAW